jgi:phosphoribosylaminoimidazolecarboxamide formyltransferase / IMP cyclohydrolase
MIKRALISVSDKRGVVEFARALADGGTEILSTGGTARALAAAGIAVTPVSEVTGAPEILDGRVKTLHPKIHGGILGRPSDAHRTEMAAHGIEAIDLVAVNLYPFEQTVAAEGTTREDAVENIDIGGPAMVRSAAKNHERVAVVVDPDDYAGLVDELRARGELAEGTRRRLACKAFAHTAAYDGAIAAYLSAYSEAVGGEPGAFPPTLTVQWERALELRYGENPHQKAAFYRDGRSPLSVAGARPSLAAAQVLQGKALSYNNLLDLDAALACCLELEGPAAVIVKHNNPCGAAVDDAGVAAAYEAARATDPTSAFGGIVAVNREVDEELAARLAETFLECVIAPSYAQAARERLASKKNLRLLATGPFKKARSDRGISLRSIAGGVLVQAADLEIASAAEAKVVTERAPTLEELRSLDFAWRVAKHVKSNAILFARGTRALAVGAGQMSRIDSVRLCTMKAQASLEGAAVASDAFFPFRDGVDALAEAGARAVIQPGGSKRDDEVIAAANEHGIAMVFTGTRHFRH